ncbi:LytTR family DNA-binding domain-containing protein [Polaribacter sp. Z022]|uniref:LytR/AlgR family response regulator transcription factor n=1 Tax=Polaribacter sp. Z022 TaxID=2927125 RepID=UPI002021BDAC|nr:LytTR family DNA-binding domain-containing protein [Polaribacter sp. Z022]MCL7753494.1 LytTR family DNA-binding domain-containing protein [Polaribacter sp. Z022]
MKIKCVIIDDEPLAIKVVENHLKEFQNFEIIQTFNNPIDALPLLEGGKIDVLFLDINMPKMNGLDFAKTLNSKTNVIITTAYREYAVESYDLNVLDYLVKPIPFNRFLKAINKITQKVYLQNGINKDDELNKDSFIFLKVDKKLVKIKFENILYVESLKDYIKVFTTTDNYLVHKSLTSVTEELPDHNFIRIHRSYTIAIDKVKSIEGNLVEIGTTKIPIGRKYVNHAKRIILNID